MGAGVSEYDRFGPWIDEVADPRDVPRLFRDHPLDLAAARLVLKVPRNIARRDATADMDLYDHLVIVGAGEVTVLSRRAAAVGVGYDVATIPLADIVAIHDVVSLLQGRLTVATSAGASITVPYNGSARQNVSRLVDTLRAGATHPPGPAAVALAAAARPVHTPDAGPADRLLVSDFLEVRRAHPDLALWACHGRRTVVPDRTGVRGAVRGALHVLSPMTLHGALVAADATMLEVFGRHSWLVRGTAPVHSVSRLVVPSGALDRADLAPHPVYPDVITVVLRAGAWATELAVPTGSGAHTLLRAAAADDVV